MRELRELHQLLGSILAQTEELARKLDAAKLFLASSGNPLPQAVSPSIKTLSIQEEKILKLIGQGKSSTRIAKELDLSERTVDAHRYNIRRKLGLDASANLKTVARGFRDEQPS